MEWVKQNKGILILILGILGLIVLNVDWSSRETSSNVSEYSDPLITTQATSTSFDSIVVEVKGEVLYPGIYSVNESMRVGDVIALAGGLTQNADTSSLNQAAKVSDEMIIEVSAKETITVIESSIVRIVVEIKGAVEHPGVYTMYQTSRVTDLVEIAGGLLDNADISEVDMAKRLSDGESIVIPEQTLTEVETEDESSEERMIYVELTGQVISPGVYYIPESYTIKDLIYEAGGVTVNCDLSKVDWNMVLVLGAVIYIPSYDDDITITDPSGLININTASIETLITLPGIGDILAQRIIDYRAEYGAFLTIEDIMKVSGIKTSVYEQIKELITV
ncbi:MAG: SLBB domain-containing protein [Bacilli bacterium]|nr:SLBB domain-containing protein [Bacilli bacterium]MBN2876803.1 SLBB domain-containing protein [Bacilli bacterium]